MRKGNLRVRRLGGGDRNLKVEKKSLDICKLARDIGTAQNGMVVKKGRIQPKDR